ncbi:MAG: tandem-95 repeat protein [Bacteroidetes bacterium]|nr:tandem-95 repeat protein [Bacteroidota bacterium]
MTGLTTGVNTFVWTITNGTCTPSTDAITINVDQLPTVADAGIDQTICSPTATLAANTPAIGTGAWTVTAGTATVTDPLDPNSGVTGLTTGVNTFTWTITNGTCTPSTDAITINVDQLPTVADAGIDQTICSPTATLAANTPAIGTGAWTVTAGTATVTDPLDPNSGVTGLTTGVNTFTWTITNGTCTPSTDAITINVDQLPTVADAGIDQTICSPTATLAANTPTVGTGAWTVTAGTGVVTTPSSPTSGVTGLTTGVNTFVWTITNGTCTPSTDAITINVDQLPTTSNAGIDQTICSPTATLAANTPTIGTGAWTVTAGTGVVTTPSSPTSGVTGLSTGVNTFTWTITNGTCTPSTDAITINVDQLPTTSNAGIDQTICSPTATLAANTPTVGTGAWTVTAGTGVVTTPSSPTSGVTGLTTGVNTFVWTITNGTCTPSTDAITINVDQLPTASNAGIDQTICSPTATLAANTPTVGTGAWTVTAGTGVVTTPSSPTSGVTGLTTGVNTFVWTITNGTCTPSTDAITINVDQLPTASNAGIDQTICSPTATLAANTPVIGTGAWTVTAGTATVTDPLDPNSGVTGLTTGVNTFTWTITNGTCTPSTDAITINVDQLPTTSNAGIDQTICSPTATLAANTPAIGTGAWTVTAGTGVVTTPSSPTSGVTGLSTGVNTFTWTITNGTCTPSTDAITINVDQLPTTSNAGIDQTICSPTATLAANTPTVGTGAWTVTAGTGVVTTPSSPTSGVTGLTTGVNTFVWTITNGTCTPSTDAITINVDQLPTTSNAGIDQTICSPTATLAANTPTVGTGAWTVTAGTATVTDPLDPNSGVTGLTTGVNTFTWTITNGTCTPSTDAITINVDQLPTTSNAGIDQTICSPTATLAANTPTVGIGAWTVTAGTGVVTAPSSPTSGVTGLSTGVNTFVWTITNGTCTPSADAITINVDQLPTVADAGIDQTICSPTATLAANTPAIGTGAWTVTAGTATVTDPLDPNSGVTGLTTGVNTFVWTITNGTCTPSTDAITINVDQLPTVADAGIDQTICSPTATLAANTPTVGTGAWTVTAGTGVVSTPSSPTSGVTGLTTGVNTFVWTITNGTCTPSTDAITINVDQLPTTSNAGIDQTICSPTATLAANTPTIGTGAWTVTAGTGVVTTPSSPTSGVTGLTTGVNTFTWTITNGTCTPSTDAITINVDQLPTTSNAGIDQTICSPTATLAANTPAIGTGAWTVTAGTGVVTTPSSPTSGVTGLSTGVNTFTWTITNGTCTPSADAITINVDQLPTTSNAGIDQTICSPTATLAANTPVVGTGSWTVTAGTGVVTTPSSPTSGVTGLSTGVNTFVWTITNGTCTPSTDAITINVDQLPTVADAGIDQTICSPTATLAANTPAIGTGAWTVTAGTATVTDPLDPNSGVTGLTTGVNTFTWTITNGTCTPSADAITINVDQLPTVADAGIDQTICSPTATLAANTPAVGTGAWTVTVGTATVTDPLDPNSGVTGLTTGVNTFVWTITNGTCTPSTDAITINVDQLPTVADAGIDQTICSPTATLAANTPTVGTGAWTVTAGTATVTDPLDPNSGVTGLTTGVNTFVWTITNGTCTPSTDAITINVDQLPTVADAGIDQTICSPTATLAANTPTVGTGAWTVTAGTATVTDPLDPNSGVTGLTTGVNTFTWTITNGTCTPSADAITINVDQLPTVADAGIDQTICSPTATLAANTPVIGTGAWTVTAGTATVTDPLDPNSGVTGLTTGVNTFTWTITNGTCTPSADAITINVDQLPTVADAGIDQTICSPTATLAANTPAIGTGAWTVTAGTATVTDPLDPNSGVTGLTTGVNTFTWTITNGTCTPSADAITINVDQLPTVADAGIDQTICSPTATLAANTPVIGTGTWTVTAGTATVTDPLDPNSGVTGLTTGVNTFVWTITNGTCTPSTDAITINVDQLPTVADAGIDQTICSPTATLAANTPAIGTGAWTVTAGTATVTDPLDPNSGVTGLTTGVNTFTWTITNGTCTPSADAITINVDQLPTVADAGIDQTICSPTATLAANTPAVGTGAWTVTAGTATVTDPLDPNSGVTGLTTGVNTFVWTITNGTCTPSTDAITINVDQLPTVADAGIDQTICSPTATLAANTPAVGTGAWTVTAGTATVTDPLDPNSGVTGLTTGVNTFVWTITNGTCTPSTDAITINVDQLPTVADAGIDQTICSPTATLAANTPVIGTGAWTVTAGTATVTDPFDPNSGVTGLTTGVNTFTWTITNGTCTPSADAITINVDQLPTVADAGIDQTICSPTATLAANTPAIGTGAWTVTAGIATVTDPLDPNSGVTGLTTGVNTFVWTITNGTCTPSTDAITINVDQLPTVADAGIDQTICSPTATLAANTPAIGTGAWTVTAGTATVTDPLDPNSGVTGLTTGVNTLVWTITNGTCTPSTDAITINVDQLPTTSNAGIDQTICSPTATLAANTPAIGTGAWTVTAGTATVTDPLDPNSGVTGLTTGVNTFTWTITNGTCTPSTDAITINVDQLPTVADAGIDQTICSPTATLAANTPAIGTGAWTVTAGTATVTDPLDPNSGVTGLTTGVNTFVWTITNGTCTPSTDAITINVDQLPTVADAGIDQTICSPTATLAANTPAVGTGAWTVTAGTATVTDPLDPNSGVTGLTTGVNTFTWTITNGTCTPSADAITINVDQLPTVADAGIDQTICSPTATLAANTPAVGAGAWTVTAGTATVTDPLDPNSGVTGLTTGVNTFVWTITNGTCTPSTDAITINVDQLPTVADAGIDQTICSPTATLAANTPAIGTGAWTVTAGTATVTDPLDPNSGVTGLTTGVNTFVWTITNGTCTPSTDAITINVDQLPTVADAGIDQTICSPTATLAANTPAIGTGAWTVTAGTATVTDPLDPNSGVTGLTTGVNTFTWTITNGTCTPSADAITINVDQLPTVADAGIDQTICSPTATLAANTPTIGTGAWTVTAGTGVVTTPSSPTSGVTGLTTGVNTFTWTITNGTCTPSTDAITINVDQLPTVADAGIDQTICSPTATLAANTPTVGTGAWTVTAGTATVTDPLDPNSGVTGLTTGVNTFVWTITNGTCTPSTDAITINVDQLPTVADAGIDQTICSPTATLAANTPTVGTGAWTVTAGTATVTDPLDPNSGVTGLTTGVNTFVWTITNGTCTPSADAITINVDQLPTVADAGIDQTICSPTATLAANTPTVGTGAWTVTAGTATVTDPLDPNSGVTGLTTGVNTFTWTITNGTCTPSADAITINVDQLPTTAIAGVDQTLCNTTNAVLAANTAVFGTGAWTVISGTGNVSNAASPTSGVTGLSLGINEFVWTITNGTCTPSADTIAITILDNTSIANAGIDQNICGSTATLAATAAVVGTGTWTVISGSAIFANANDPATSISGIAVGVNVYQWTIDNLPCSSTSDQIIVNSNCAPIAIDDSYNTNEDVILNGSTVLVNDSDPDGGVLTVNTTPVTNVTNGTLLLNANGTFTYTPNAGFNGVDTFVYTICDDGTPVLCSNATVTITVGAVNDAPVAIDDAYSTNEDVVLNGSTVLVNDSDPEGDVLTVNTTPLVNVTNGILVLNSDGTFTYTPNLNFTGIDTFTYEVCDNGIPVLCDNAVVTITVSAINDAPLAVDDNATTPEDVVLNGTTVLSNDTDPEGGILTVNTVPLVNVSNGILVLNANGTYTYTPNPNFNGTDSFTYQVCDNGVPIECSSAIVTITVTPVNDNPIAIDDAYSTNEDVVLNGSTVLVNDTDTEGDVLSVNTTPVVNVVNGILILNSDGTFTYTPNPNFVGIDSFVYQVCDNGTPVLCDNATVVITINSVNDGPIAIDDNATVAEDAVLIGASVLANDTDPDGNLLSVNTTPFVNVTNGVLVLNSNGTYTYTPNANFNGIDSFTYIVCDDGVPSLCDTAVVTITVTQVNDLPLAVNDTYTTNEDVTVNGSTVLVNDSDPENGILTVNTTPITNVSSGVLVLNSDGTFTYTPNANFNGTDSFVYQVCDDGTPIQCAQATVTITVTPVNDAPIAVDDVATVAEDGVLNGATVLVNDSDPEGDVLTVNTTPFVNVSNGVLVLNSNGTYTYTPNTNFNGIDSFTYVVCDNGIPSLCDTAIVTITVTQINDLPIALDDAYSTNEDVVLNASTVLVNDTDPEAGILTVNTTPVTNVTNGVLVLNSDGTFTYTPNLNFNGIDSFVYSVCDDGTPVQCSNATVTITVNSVNDGPIAIDDNANTLEGVTLNGTTVLINDTDPDGNNLTVNTTPFVNVTNGSLTLNANGTYTYIPNPLFNGIDTFTYIVCDDGVPSLCDTAVVTIAVGAVNNAPIAIDDAYSTNEDVVLNGTSVLLNDSDPENDALTVNTTPFVNVTNGVLVLNSDGTFTYTPNANFNGIDSFVYTVCDDGIPVQCSQATVTITVTPVNDAPLAVDDVASVNEDGILNGTTVLINDSDIEGDVLTVNTTPVTAPTNGVLVLNANGTYTYTPNANFNGTDTFSYEVCDNGIPSECDTALVTITVNPVNDSPVAIDDAYSTNEDVTLNGSTVLVNDSDPEAGILTVNTTPFVNVTNGVLILNSDGTFTYTPNANFNGIDSFVYTVCDNGTPVLCAIATVTITVNAINDAPLAVDDNYSVSEDNVLNGTTVLANDTDPEGDALTVNTTPIVAPVSGILVLNSNGTFTYTPNPNFNGTDSFVYQVCDNGSPVECSNATVFITVTPVNDTPLALDDSYSTPEDVTLNGTTVLINDTDPEGGILTVNTTPLTNTTNGVLVLNANGTFTYTPNPNFNGIDFFVYQVCDNGTPVECTSATVTITVTPTNDAPIAVDDNYIIPEDNVLNGTSVLANDTDPEGNNLSVNTTPVVAPVSGVLVLNSDGTFTYTPNANFNGSDSFVYQVCDDGTPVECSLATVFITVTPVNDAPLAVDDNASTTEDVVLNGASVLLNDSDPENDALTVNTTPVVAPVSGVLVLNANGTYTYTPNLNFNGNDSFVYSVCDNGIPSLCAQATVFITVNPVNDVPIANDDVYSTAEDNILNGASVLTNDTDPENGNLTVNTTPVTNVTNGVLVLNSDGTFTYTPNLNFNGIDFFVYDVCDDGTPVQCTQATVTITVTPVNDNPVAIDDNANTLEGVTLNGTTVLANDSDPEGDVLTVNTSPLVNVSNGTLTLNSNGNYIYTPNPLFNGFDTFTYVVCDNGIPSLCDTAVVTISVGSVNDAPIAVNDTYTTNEDVVLNGTSVLLNDSDPENDILTVNTTPVVNVANGVLVLNADGTFTYTPNANFNGTDSFVYSVCDNGIPVQCSSALVTITVTPINDNPLAIDDVATVAEDGVLNGASVLLNDSDPEGDVLTVNTTPFVAPLSGILILNANGTYTYTPNANFTGIDSFTYVVCDNGTPSECDTAVVTITVTPVNDAPIAVDDVYSTNEDVVLNGSTILVNDSDPENDVLTVNTTPIVNVVNGTLILNANGTFTYTPNANFTGIDFFIYSVCDNGIPSQCSQATVTINVDPINDAPIAVDDNATTPEDVVLNGASVLLNDADPENDALTVTTTPVIAPVNGVLVLNANGTYTYTPNANFNGSDSFVYQVCDNGTPVECSTATVFITITPVNDAPIAVDDNASTTEDVVLNGTTVLANDNDPEGGILTVNTTPVVAPISGILVLNANGTYTYTPNLNFNGTDSFVYSVCDNGIPTQCAQATVFITVNPVNDTPVAGDDVYTIAEDNVLNGSTVLANDADPENGVLTVNTTPITNVTNGTLVLNSDGTFTYTPNLNFNGVDFFVYTVCDDGVPIECTQATVTITVTPVNDAPIAIDDNANTLEGITLNGTTVLANDSDPENDVLTVNTTPLVNVSNGTLTLNGNGTYTYIPNPLFNGFDTFTYVVCDNGVPSICDTAIVTIAVGAVNNAPIAVNDVYTTPEDIVLNGNVLTNDSDPENDSLFVNTTPVVNVANGVLILNVDGTFTYTPNANYVGSDSFVYTVCDNGSPVQCSSALVTITVSAVNDAPLAVDDNATITEDAVLNGTSVLLNDSDPENDVLTVSTTPFINVANGTLLLNANGTYTYTPNLNFFGVDSFTYVVCDNGIPSLCDTAVVTITVTPINDAPFAVNDTVTVVEDNILNAASVLLNDTDVENDNLTVNTTPVINVLNGTLLLNSNGTFTYTPNPNFFGNDFFVYSVCDDGVPSQCSQATVFITVTPVNDAPVALDDNASVPEDGVLNSPTVLTNDSDPENGILTVNTTPLVNVTNGTLVLNANGTYTYTPNANFNGSDTFTYIVCDNGTPSECDTAVVTITVTPVNDAPLAVDDNYSTGFGVTLNATTVLVNDSDIDGITLTVNTIPAVNPVSGVLTLNSNGTFTYIPNPGFSGIDSFVYTVCDGGTPDECANATVFITVGNNTAPIALNDTFSVAEDNTLSIAASGVLINDSDLDNNALTVVNFDPISVNGGTVVVNANGSFTYTPFLNFNGSDSFTYVISDGFGGTDTASVIITVTPVNDAPIALDDVVSGSGGAVNGNVLPNDSDIENDSLIVNTTPVVNVSNGTLVLNADGSFTYTPNPGFTGIDTFTYAVCDDGIPSECDSAIVVITINNVAPVAVDDAYTTPSGTTLNGTSVLANDTDANGGTLTASLLTTTANGVLIFNSDGTFTYTPTVGFVGNDTLVYVVCDGGAPALCDTGIAVITVENAAPIAVTDTYNTPYATVLNGTTVLVNDVDVNGDPLSISVQQTPSNGLFTMSPNGTFTYTPNAGFSGTDTLIYQICDNAATPLCDTAIVFLIVGNASPIAVDDNYSTPFQTVLNGTTILVNDTDPNGDTLTVSVLLTTTNGVLTMNTDGTFTYTPANGFSGNDTFTYVICDANNACDTAVVTISVGNATPIAVNDTYSTPFQTVLNAATVLANDSDPNGDPLTVTVIATTTNGTLTMNANGTFTYTPNNGFAGVDTFSYTICDPNNACDTAVVTITVGNATPIAVNDTYTTPFQTVLNASTVLANDSDPNGDTLTVAVINNTTNGTLVMNANGTFTYTPNNGFTGVDTFTYSICDPNGACDTAVVTITVGNAFPIAVNDTYSTPFQTVLNGTSVLANDTDPNGDPLTVTVIANTTNGILVMNANGTFTYTPATGFTGTDTFTYTICDPNGACDTALATITVGNATPVAVNDTYSTPFQTVLNAPSVALNDTDPNGDPLSVTVVTTTANGTLVMNVNGTFTYTPNAGFSGTDTFSYSVCDPNNACDTATVTITVGNGNPIANVDNFATPFNTAISDTVITNDSDPNNDPLTVTLVSTTTNGTLVLNANGTFTYTPTNGFAGVDSFIYNLCDNRTPPGCDTAIVFIYVGNIAPVATVDHYSTPTNIALAGTSVLVNDFDANNDPLTITVISTTTNGTLVMNANGTFTYTPNNAFTGPDSFIYQICDNGNPVLCDTAIVFIDVLNAPPVAITDTYVGALNTTTSAATVFVNDSDLNGDPFTIGLVDSTKNGALFINANGTFLYTPANGFCGTDNFIYKITDTHGDFDTAIVFIVINCAPIGIDHYDTTSVNVNITNDVPDENLLFGVTDPDGDNIFVTPVVDALTDLGGTITIDSLGNYSYTPPYNVTSGDDFFVFTICDDGIPKICVNYTLHIHITPVFYPGGFSPNGDGVNDFLVISGAESLRVGLTVFNRWGNRVFEDLNYKNTWNGSANKGVVIGEGLPDGTYWYIVDLFDGKKPEIHLLTIKR